MRQSAKLRAGSARAGAVPGERRRLTAISPTAAGPQQPEAKRTLRRKKRKGVRRLYGTLEGHKRSQCVGSDSGGHVSTTPGAWPALRSDRDRQYQDARAGYESEGMNASPRLGATIGASLPTNRIAELDKMPRTDWRWVGGKRDPESPDFVLKTSHPLYWRDPIERTQLRLQTAGGKSQSSVGAGCDLHSRGLGGGAARKQDTASKKRGRRSGHGGRAKGGVLGDPGRNPGRCSAVAQCWAGSRMGVWAVRRMASRGELKH